MPQMKTAFLLLFWIILVLLFGSGCAALMPSEATITNSPWKTYDEAKNLFDRIEPYKTTLEDLKNMSLDPYKIPNTKILNAISVRNLFVVSPSTSLDDLPSGIHDCLHHHNFEKCIGFEYRFENIKSKGIGNLFLRIFSFKKETHTTGRDITFQIFLINNIVVYKLIPEGISEIDKFRKEIRPLGPLQEPFGIFQNTITPSF